MPSSSSSSSSNCFTWAKLLNTFCKSGKLELELLYKVQVQCYEDTKLMKLFPEVVRSLYDQEVLAEDTILHWGAKGTNPKGRYVFFIVSHKVHLNSIIRNKKLEILIFTV
ncbi:putative W2 domain, MIF4G-like domain superfamily protein [Helianthus anomalus]